MNELLSKEKNLPKNIDKDYKERNGLRVKVKTKWLLIVAWKIKKFLLRSHSIAHFLYIRCFSTY